MTVAVYYDDARELLFVSGMPEAFPPRALVAVRISNIIEIWVGQSTKLVRVDFSRITDEAGGTFASAVDAKAYLDDQFSRSPSLARAFEHTQSAPSATWTINHNLGFRPSVTLFTVGGVEFEAEIIHLSDNQCVVYIATSIAGQARCN